MKTKKELSALKEEVETMNEKLHELTDEELAQVVGGAPNGKALTSTLTSTLTVAVGAFAPMATAEDIEKQISGVK